jgi:lysophospholipase L1-like esterase
MDVVTLGMAKADAKKKYATQKQFGAARRLVVANTYGCADATPQTVIGTFDFPAVIGADTADISFVYGNFYTAQVSNVYGDYTPATSVTIGGAALVIQGVGVYPLTFNGAVGATVAPGGFVTSDHLPITLAKGTTVFLRTYVSGGTWYANHISAGATGNGGSSASNLTVAGSTSTALQVAGSHYGPMAVLGTVADGSPAFVLEGDSIAHGYADSNTFSGYAPADLFRSGGGYLQRAINGKAGAVNIAFPGDKASAFAVPGGYLRRSFFKRYATHAVIEYPRNDISDEVPLATTQANVIKIAVADKRRGLKTVLTTITPKTSSTDNWMTTAGQSANTAAAETIRQQWNTWLRDGAPMDSTLAPLAAGTTSGSAIRIGAEAHPFGAYWEITDLVESSRNSGLWSAPDRVLADGAMTSGTSLLNSATANFTSADVGKAVSLNGAGAAGAVYQSIIRQVNSATQVLMNSNAGTTVSGATFGIGVKTFDGVHPNQYGAALCAGGVNLTSL